MGANSTAEVGQPTFASYPTFERTSLPGTALLSRPTGEVLIETKLEPAAVWHGLIRPFEDDQSAKLVSRALAAERPLDVHGGYLLAPPEAKWLRAHPDEVRLSDMTGVFEVLVLEFAHTPDPWAFSLAPAISSLSFPGHPHLRQDRKLSVLDLRLEGLCIYSAAEFSFDPTRERIPQFLDQFAIFLGKHLVWDRTRRLYDAKTNKILNESPTDLTLYSSIPTSSLFERVPSLTTQWKGYWPGSTAPNGPDHLSLNPDGPCWCGDGLAYKDCHLTREKKFYGLKM